MGTKPKEGEEPDQMKKIILHYRNRALADRIAADSNDKIYIGKIDLDGDTLYLKGCVAGGLLCASQTWKRVQ